MESEYLRKRFLLFNTISNKLDHIYSYDEKSFNKIEALLNSYVHEYEESDCCLIKKFYLIKNGFKESIKKHR